MARLERVRFGTTRMTNKTLVHEALPLCGCSGFGTDEPTINMTLREESSDDEPARHYVTHMTSDEATRLVERLQYFIKRTKVREDER